MFDDRGNVRGVAAFFLFVLGTTTVVRAAEPTAPPAKPQPGAASQPPAPKPPAVVEVPAPESVTVVNARPLKTFVADPYFLSDVSPSLRGATIFIRPFGRNPPDVNGGKITLEITADGPVVVAVSWQYDGRIEDAWQGELWDGRKFFDEGWRLIDFADVLSPATLQPDLRLFYARDCRAGEKITIRTRKYSPSWVLVPKGNAVEPHVVDWEPSAKLPEEQQRDFVAQKFRALLLEKRFDELHAWTTRYLNTSAMFPSGHYKIVSTRRLIAHHFPDNKLTVAQSREYLALSEAWLEAMPDSIPAKLNTANLLVDLSEQLEYLKSAEHGPEIDESRRRAMELLYEVERDDPTIVDTYRTILELAVWARWSAELVDEYVERVLTHCGWSQSALDRAYNYYTRKFKDESVEDRNRRLHKFFDLIAERTRERYGDALFAAMLANWRHQPIDWPMHNYDLKWPRIKASFEDWIKLFPESTRIKQQYCLWASFNGDREAAARLFATFTDAEADVDEVWVDRDRLATRRAWAAADFASGDQTQLVEYPVNQILSARVRPDGRIVVADVQGAVTLVDPSTGAMEKYGKTASGPPYWHSAAHVHTPDGGRYFYGAYYGYLGFIYVRTPPRYNQRWRRSGSTFTAVAVAPDEKSFVAAGETDDFLVYVVPEGEWKREYGEPLRSWTKSHPAVVRGFGFCNDGRNLVVLYADGLLELRNYDDGDIVKSWPCQAPKEANAMTISVDGRLLATVGNDRLIRIWTLPDGELTRTLPALPTVVETLAFSPDGKLLAAGDGYRGIRPGSIHLYDYELQKFVRTYSGHKASISVLQFLPDGKTLMSASRDMSIRYWNLTAQEEQTTP